MKWKLYWTSESQRSASMKINIHKAKYCHWYAFENTYQLEMKYIPDFNESFGTTCHTQYV